MTFFLQFWSECCNVYYMVHLVQKKSTELVEKLFPIKYFLWKGTNGKWTQLHHSSTHHTTSKYSFLWYRNQRVMLTPNKFVNSLNLAKLKVWAWLEATYEYDILLFLVHQLCRLLMWFHQSCKCALVFAILTDVHTKGSWQLVVNQGDGFRL